MELDEMNPHVLYDLAYTAIGEVRGYLFQSGYNLTDDTIPEVKEFHEDEQALYHDSTKSKEIIEKYAPLIRKIYKANENKLSSVCSNQSQSEPANE